MKFFVSLTSALLFSAPGLLLTAFPTGPGAGRTGGPGDGGTCTGGSCHFGAVVRGEGIALKFPDGPFYKPGVSQRIQVQIHGIPTESETAVYGFQLSARMASNPGSAPGGKFNNVELGTWVQCASGATPSAAGCPPGQEIQYIQHQTPSKIPAWEMEWTPPVDASGPIQFFVAANAANGRGDQAGDRIFADSFLVLPAGSLTAHHVLGGGRVSPLSWVRVQGAFRELGELSFGGLAADRMLLLAPGQLLALVPSGTPLGRQTLRLGALESEVEIRKSAPEIASSSLTIMTVGSHATLQVLGCGDAPEKASVWIANRSVEASIGNQEQSPGACQLNFPVPNVPPGDYWVRACVDGSCSMGRTKTLIQ